MKRRMWSHVARCLLAGVAITIGLAWWSEYEFALFAGLSKQIATSPSGPSWEGVLLSRGSTASGVLSWAVMQEPAQLKSPIDKGPRWSRIRIPPTSIQIASYESILEDARGWPLPALLARHVSDTSFAAWKTEWGIRLATDQGRWGAPRALPLRPLFPGFIVDVVFWSALTWCAAQQFIIARAKLRLSKGRCPQCAHILIPDQARCPECGTRISMREV